MARHFMAVCVVCLLCAEHLPCKQHFEESLQDPKQLLQKHDYSTMRSYIDKTMPATTELYNIEDRSLSNKKKGRTKDVNTEEIINDYPATVPHARSQRRRRRQTIHTDPTNTINSVRTKRHDQHHHHHDDHSDGEQSQVFVRKLFEQFGDSNALTMNVLGFEKMLKHLGLYRLLDEQLPAPDNNNQNNKESNDTCISSTDFVSRVSSAYHNSRTQHPPLDNRTTKLITNGHATMPATGNGSVTNDSLPAYASYVLPQSDNKTHTNPPTNEKENLYLNSEDMIAICPILLYQMTAGTSKERSGCISSSLIPHDFYAHHGHADDYGEGGSDDRTLVWIYAMLSIIIASLCGLFAVLVIPCMDKDYYHYLLQFFVALGVGTLAGDALLHLLPHAMMTNSKTEDAHHAMTLKGLAAAAGMVFFFLTERALTMVAEWRKQIQKKEKPSSRVRVMRDPDTASVQNPAAEKLCKAKYSSYPYCYDEIDMDTKDDHHHHKRESTSSTKCPPSPTATTLGGSGRINGGTGSSNHHHHHEHSLNHNHNHKNNYKHQDHHDYLDTAQSLLTTHNNYTISDGYEALRAGKEETRDHNAGDTTTVSTNLDNGSVESHKTLNLAPAENYTIILREHEAKHHGHSHTHGHVHSPPSSFSAVAWMVIMGDGLHNFTDGMAIGAAFSNNIAGGFSTAVAVLCHELPHELGDFAILLKAGMSTRKAVCYNLLSSVLSFIGTIIGIWIGETPEASAWIFACAAGMFLYIALVDMMPELNSSHKETFAFTQLILQFVGISIGVGIMLLIAIYEHDLKSIFSSHD